MAFSTMISAACHIGQSALLHSASSLRRLLSDRRGIASVQFAMALPVLFGTIMGTVDMGHMLMAQNTLVHAANEATRFAMVRSASSEHAVSKEDIVALVKVRMTGLDASQAEVKVNWIPENQPGARVTVDVDYPYTLSALGMGTVNLKGSSSTFVTH
ncbi:MAG: pilus assembly protein [Alphaproteobacteria bacterium]|nr:pilus assembly protein [Alphaproteobacteria bacterium]